MDKLIEIASKVLIASATLFAILCFGVASKIIYAYLALPSEKLLSLLH